MLTRSRPVSIEIGAESVKVAQLLDRRGSVRVVRFAEQELPPGFRWEVGGDRGPVVEAIRGAMASAGIRTRAAIMSLPRGQVTARVSALPAADQNELRRVVEFDLGDHIPFPVDQVVVDFQRLGHSREQPGLVDVLVVAAPRDLVREHLRVAQEAGLRVAAVAVDALALDDLVRLAGREPAGLTAAIEIGPRTTTINVSQGNVLRLTRSVGVGGNQLLRAIQDDLRVDAGEAQRLREAVGLELLDRQPSPPAVQAWLNGLLGEIRRSALSFGPARIARVMLVGAAAGVPGLAGRLKAEFGAEPVTLSATTAFAGAEFWGRDPETADRCLLTMAAGLRAIGRSAWTLSLLPEDVFLARRRALVRRAAVAGLAAVLAAMIAGYVASAREAARMRARVRELGIEANRAAEQQRVADERLAERDRLRNQVEALDIVRIRRYAALELLRSAALYAPKEVSLTHFTMRPEQPLELRGHAPDSGVAADLGHSLGQLPLVKQVALTSAERASPSRPTRQQEREQRANQLTFTMQLRLWTEKEAEPRGVSIRRQADAAAGRRGGAR